MKDKLRMHRTIPTERRIRLLFALESCAVVRTGDSMDKTIPGNSNMKAVRAVCDGNDRVRRRTAAV